MIAACKAGFGLGSTRVASSPAPLLHTPAFLHARWPERMDTAAALNHCLLERCSALFVSSRAHSALEGCQPCGKVRCNGALIGLGRGHQQCYSHENFECSIREAASSATVSQAHHQTQSDRSNFCLSGGTAAAFQTRAASAPSHITSSAWRIPD